MNYVPIWESARVVRLAAGYWKNPQMAEDMAQEMRLSLWQGNGMSSAFRDALDQARTKKYSYKQGHRYIPHVSYGIVPDYLSMEAEVEDTIINRVYLENMRECLTEVEQEVLDGYLEGYCFREIGEWFDRSVWWSCTIYHRCLDKLREYIRLTEEGKADSS